MRKTYILIIIIIILTLLKINDAVSMPTLIYKKKGNNYSKIKSSLKKIA